MQQPVGPCLLDHAVELPARDGHPQDRPGDRRRLHDGRQAGPADAADDARCWPQLLERGRPARRRAQRRHRRTHSGEVIEPLIARPAAAQAHLHRLDRGRQDAGRAGRRAAAADVDGARRQRPVPRLRRRRPRRRGRRRDAREDAQHRRGLHRGQPLPRARVGRRGVRRRSWPSGWARSTRRPRHRGRRRRRPADRRQGRATRSPSWSTDAVGKGATVLAGGGAASTAPATSTSRPCSPTSPPTRACLERGDLRPGRAGHRPSPTRTRRSRRPTTPSTAWSPTSSRSDLDRALRVGRGARDRHDRPQPAASSPTPARRSAASSSPASAARAASRASTSTSRPSTSASPCDARVPRVRVNPWHVAAVEWWDGPHDREHRRATRQPGRTALTAGRRSRRCSSTPTSRSSAEPGPAPRSGPPASTCSTPPSTVACAPGSSCCSAATRARARPTIAVADGAQRGGAGSARRRSSPTSTPPRASCSASSRSRRPPPPSPRVSTRPRPPTCTPCGRSSRPRTPTVAGSPRRSAASPTATTRSTPCTQYAGACRCTSRARTPPPTRSPGSSAAVTDEVGEPPIVLVDYLQKMPLDGYVGDETSRVTIVTETMKDMSLELECPIVCISAADREALGSGHRMRTRDLRGSSAAGLRGRPGADPVEQGEHRLARAPGLRPRQRQAVPPLVGHHASRRTAAARARSSSRCRRTSSTVASCPTPRSSPSASSRSASSPPDAPRGPRHRRRPPTMGTVDHTHRRRPRLHRLDRHPGPRGGGRAPRPVHHRGAVRRRQRRAARAPGGAVRRATRGGRAGDVDDVRAALAAAAAEAGRPASATEVVVGPDAATVAAGCGADVVLNGVTGSIGLRPTLAALAAGLGAGAGQQGVAHHRRARW